MRPGRFCERFKLSGKKKNCNQTCTSLSHFLCSLFVQWLANCCQITRLVSHLPSTQGLRADFLVTVIFVLLKIPKYTISPTFICLPAYIQINFHSIHSFSLQIYSSLNCDLQYLVFSSSHSDLCVKFTERKVHLLFRSFSTEKLLNI